MNYDDDYAPIDEDEWYYFVRKGTNDIWLNKANERNVCVRSRIGPMLDGLNQYEDLWEAMTIAQYKRKFGDV